MWLPKSADWRALGEVCELWDDLGRQRIENYILALGEFFRRRIASVFGDDALMQPMYDPELKSGIVDFNPFPGPNQRRDAQSCANFQDRLLKECNYHTGGEELGSNGLTRAPDPEAGAFPAGSIPNRDPITNAPAPTDYPMRVNACLWNDRTQIDRLVAACEQLVKDVAA